MLWDELPDDLKDIVLEVSEEEAIRGYEDLCLKDMKALANFRDYDCAVETLSPEIEEAFIKEAKAYQDELADGDDFYAEVLRSLRAFEAIQLYAEQCE
jgi:TRAP-type C4-dicarboxylate transport system substrate-binding protein